MGRRRVPRRGLVFFPVQLLLLLPLLLGLLLVPLVVFTVGEILGLTTLEAALAFGAIVLGSAVNLPVRVVETRVRVATPPAFPLMGWLGRPRTERRRTVLAVNVGGALVPAALSVSFLASLPASAQVAGLGAVVAVAAVAYVVAEPVPGTGIAVPALVPPMASVGAAGLGFAVTGAPLSGVGRAAFAAGSLGTLIGADVLNLGRLEEIGAPVVSVGGAGTFDGIVLSGVFAALFAALLLGA